MILNGVEQVVAELKVGAEYGGDNTFDCHHRQTAQKGLDLIAALQLSAGPEKWIEYSGHLTLALYHAARFGSVGKRGIYQVWVDPRPPFGFGDIHYLLPAERRPWEYASGTAQDVPTAAAMIIEALGRCEQRDEHLYESYA